MISPPWTSYAQDSPARHSANLAIDSAFGEWTEVRLVFGKERVVRKDGPSSEKRFDLSHSDEPTDRERDDLDPDSGAPATTDTPKEQTEYYP